MYRGSRFVERAASFLRCSTPAEQTIFDYRVDPKLMGPCSLNDKEEHYAKTFKKTTDEFLDFAKELITSLGLENNVGNPSIKILDSVQAYIELVKSHARKEKIQETTKIKFPEWYDISDHYGVEALVIIEPEMGYGLYGKEMFDYYLGSRQLPLAHLQSSISESPLQHIQPLGNLYKNMNWFSDEKEKINTKTGNK